MEENIKGFSPSIMWRKSLQQTFLDAFLKKPIQEKWNLSNLFILTNLALFGIEERKGTKLPIIDRLQATIFFNLLWN